MKSKVLVALAATAAAAAVPAAASAATFKVTAGPPAPKDAALKKSLSSLQTSDVNAFFPSTLTVRTTDKVAFESRGFHNFHFPKKGDDPTGLLSPGAAVGGALDAAGQPFWFNGQPSLGITPSLLSSSFGKSVTVTGSKAVDSGLPLGPSKPMTARFSKPGSYQYFCSVHPGMTGRVNVKSSKASVPSAARAASRAQAQLKAAAATAQKLVKRADPQIGVEAGRDGAKGVHVFEFFPKQKAVKVGQALTFLMPKGSSEVHTITFGPGDPLTEPMSYLGQIAKTLESPSFSPLATYPSDPPTAPITVTPQSHGNGFANSGFLAGFEPLGLPRSSVMRFGAPGTYTYLCIIHPFMKGSVVVS